MTTTLVPESRPRATRPTTLNLVPSQLCERYKAGAVPAIWPEEPREDEAGAVPWIVACILIPLAVGIAAVIVSL